MRTGCDVPALILWPTAACTV